MITTVILIVKTITFICLKESNYTGEVGENVKFRYVEFGPFVGHTWGEKTSNYWIEKPEFKRILRAQYIHKSSQGAYSE